MDMLERVIIMMPSMFGESLFDDWFDDLNSEFFGKKNPLYGKHSKNLMKTDVRETEGTYEVDIDLPGFKKEDINVQLENGYLTITASKGLNKDEKNKEGAYIRQERYSGSMSRSFYVGDIPISIDKGTAVAGSFFTGNYAQAFDFGLGRNLIFRRGCSIFRGRSYYLYGLSGLWNRIRYIKRICYPSTSILSEPTRRFPIGIFFPRHLLLEDPVYV